MPTRRGATRPPARAITSNEPGSGRRNGRHHPDGHAESEDVAWFVKIGGGSRLTAASRPGCIKDSHQRKSPAQPPTRTTKVLVFKLINAETRVPKGIAGLFLAGDISGRWRAQDFSTLSPEHGGRSPEKRASRPTSETRFRNTRQSGRDSKNFGGNTELRPGATYAKRQCSGFLLSDRATDVRSRLPRNRWLAVQQIRDACFRKMKQLFEICCSIVKHIGISRFLMMKQKTRFCVTMPTQYIY